MAEPSYDECLVEAELKARAAYSEPHRHYHDQRHLDECLDLVSEARDLTDTDRRLLRWAILWHDAVYDPANRDNEERSAELAHLELTRCGISAEAAAEVVRLIRLTERHEAAADDRRGALMVSIDLAILGSNPKRYREYAADVRREYAHVPDPIWNSGRTRVLSRLLDKHPLFPDPRFAYLEAPARRNLQEEISRLAAARPAH